MATQNFEADRFCAKVFDCVQRTPKTSALREVQSAVTLPACTSRTRMA